MRIAKHIAILLTLCASAGRAEPVPALPQADPMPPTATCHVLDALAQPIAGAEVTLIIGPSEDVAQPGMQAVTDAAGVFVMPAATRAGYRVGRVSHPDYGSGQATIDPHGKGFLRLVVPLVKSGTAAADRALKGTVKGPEGNPIVGARLHCVEVRTPGEGLISHHGATALTDKKGCFSLYLPTGDDSRRGERGEIIPPNSRFMVQIESPSDPTLFPFAAALSNTKEAEITLKRPEKRYSFKYQSRDGVGLLTNEQVNQGVSICYRPAKDDEKMVLVPRRYRLGGLLPAGTYTASCSTGTVNFDYQPLVIRDDSPPELVFRVPSTITFRGRVVEGTTGKPLPGAFVIGMTGSTEDHLAGLDDEGWNALHTLPNYPAVKGTAAETLEKFYHFLAIARTDKEGRYSLLQPPGQEIHSALAFDQHFVPYSLPLYSFRRGEPRKSVDLPDLPLFPAARVLVEPVFQHGKHLAVSPDWVIEKDGQPPWIERFKNAPTRDNGGEFAYVDWLKLNEAQPVFIPAGVKLKLRLRTPYDEQWVADEVDRVLQVAQGGTTDLGKIAFRPTLSVAVRVTDQQDRPLEGMPVRRMLVVPEGERVWSIAHNTDAQGTAHFFISPNSKVQFRVDMPDGDRDKPATIEAEVGDAPPKEPPVIRLSDEQIKKSMK